MVTIALEEFKKSWLEGVTTTPYLDGEMLMTPWSLPNGRTFDIFVRRLDTDWFMVSDRGFVADHLAESGVDVSRGVGARSWGMLRRDLEVSFGDASEFEVAATTARATLGQTINEIAGRALQGAALTVLARSRRPKGFAERAMDRAASFNLGVLPKPLIENKFGGRRHVTFLAEGDRGRSYVMALGGEASFTEAHDRAKLAFDDAQVHIGERATLIAREARPLPWHRASLESISNVYNEADESDLWRKLQAA